mmetsp:Transcript_96158/g.170675  ORF Transcript_96158/g.170675 Transcript_96158/m.170675 type:complete len:228 (-) Transcript_96158:467-1150(-)
MQAPRGAKFIGQTFKAMRPIWKGIRNRRSSTETSLKTASLGCLTLRGVAFQQCKSSSQQLTRVTLGSLADKFCASQRAVLLSLSTPKPMNGGRTITGMVMISRPRPTSGRALTTGNWITITGVMTLRSGTDIRASGNLRKAKLGKPRTTRMMRSAGRQLKTLTSTTMIMTMKRLAGRLTAAPPRRKLGPRNALGRLRKKRQGEHGRKSKGKSRRAPRSQMHTKKKHP